MAFKKLIWHIYVAVAFHRLPGSGRGSLGDPLQQFPPRPLPLPLEGPAQDSRESGRAWGEPGAAFRAGWGRPQAEGVAEGTRGGAGAREAGSDPRALQSLPGIPPQALRKTRNAVLQPPLPPSLPPPTCHCS